MDDPRIALVADLIRTVPDFPKPGIQFKDITPVLEEPEAFRACIDLLAGYCASVGATKILGIDARGFIFGAAVAYQLQLGLILVRKKGKLPYKTNEISYDLEYGSSTIEMHVDSVQPGETVVLVDDLLATGGTAAAAIQLVHRSGAEVPMACFVIELAALEGRSRLAGTEVRSLLTF